jgi:hypothetical protein
MEYLQTKRDAMAEGKLILCPYCGHTQPAGDRCAECRGLFEPLSRHATQIAMGPWFIRDKAQPFRPGCSYEVLVKQVEAGRIKPTTVLRGPTTRQFWSVARNVPGVAHLLGYCYRCGAKVKPDAMSCRECFEQFHEPRERNELGLMYPTAEDARVAQRALEREIAGGKGGLTEIAPIRHALAAGTDRLPPLPMTQGADLLDEVVREVGPRAAGRGAKPPPRTPPARDAAPRSEAAEALSFEPSEEPPVSSQSTAGVALHRRNVWIVVLGAIVLILLAVEVFMVMHTPTAAGRGNAPAPPAIDHPRAIPAQPSGESILAPNLNHDDGAAAEPEGKPPAEATPDGGAERSVLAHAKDLENAGHYAEALQLLRDAQNRTPESRRTDQMRAAIQRLEDLVREQNATRFLRDATQ